MIDKELNVVIIFNGEIYDTDGLKTELVKKGYQFRGHSDTEVLLNLYLEYGIEMLNKLNGMFGIAIYDKRMDRLYLARDRIGIKPVYYYIDENILMFASELKSIVKSGAVPIEIDNLAYREIFTFGYSLKRTVVKNVFPLQPGTYLEYSGGGG